MAYDIWLILRILIAVIAAVVLGNGSVVAFNRAKQSWFADYDESSSDASRKILPPALLEADNAGRQRIPSSPWKYAFTGYFAICGLYLAVRGGTLVYEIDVLCVLFITLEMAIADQLYKTVPDCFFIMLAVMAIGFSEYHEKWWEPLAGAGLGLAISAAVLGLGFLIFHTGSMGGADIKFFACIGLVTGRTGAAAVFILTTLLFALYSFVKIALGRGTIKDYNAMLPSAAAAVTIYLLFLFNAGDILTIEL